MVVQIGDRDRIVKDLREAAELAERYDKRIAYEPLAWAQHVYTWEYGWELVQEVNHVGSPPGVVGRWMR